MLEFLHRIRYSRFLLLGKLKRYIAIPLVIIGGSVVYLHVVDEDIKEDFIDKIHIHKYFSSVERENLSEVTEDNYKSIEIRKILWSNTLSVIQEKPLLGAGKGNWCIAIGKHATARLPDRLTHHKSYSHVHNDYLQQLAETGITGFLLFIIPIILLLWT
jgi:hypothetical protein